MDRLVAFLFRQSKLILIVWALLSVGGAALASQLESQAVPGGEASSSSQAEAVARELSANDVPSLYLVVSGRAAQQPGDLKLVQRRVAAITGVREVAPLPLPPAAADAGPVTVLGVTADGGNDGAIAVARRLLDSKGLATQGSSVLLGGYAAHREELVQLSQTDLLRAEKVGVPIVLLVLLLTFGSPWATVVPLVIGATALLGGLGAAGALAFGVPFSEYVTNAASMVGLALAIDYAMFLVQRVREAMLTGMDVDSAVRSAMRTTGVAIAWSGLTVLLAEATMLLIDSRSIRTAGLGMMMVTATAVVAALIVGPIVLRLLGPRILRKTDRHWWRRSTGQTVAGSHRLGRTDRSPRPDVSAFWHRWGEWVTRRPKLALAGAGLILAGLCAPAVNLYHHVDLPAISAMPATSQVRQASELGAKAFGPGVLSPVEIVVHGPEIQATRIAQILRGNPDVADAQVLPLNVTQAYRVSVATTHGPADSRTESFVQTLRSGPLRTSLAGIRYEVGGESALRLDATQALFAGLPLMVVVLLALVGLVFAVAMRSIVLAIKGMALVVLSLGATAGVLLLLSTTGPGAHLIGWSHPQQLHPIVPVTIVAIVVALSTDYEVILVSRIGERYRATRDNTASIIDGVAHTGRVISSAAAIMIAVFFGFTLSDVTPLRQLGVGLAFAVFIDATIIRGVLVPASMQLLGRWNWWWPVISKRSLHLPSPHTKGPVPCVGPIPALPTRPALPPLVSLPMSSERAGSCSPSQRSGVSSQASNST